MAKVLEQPLFFHSRFLHGQVWGMFMFCTVCGNRGIAWSHGDKPLPWALNCLRNRDHPWRCSCGLRYPSKLALAAHVRAEGRWRPDARHEKLGLLAP